MDKLRLRLLICLIIIFLITAMAFVLTLFGDDETGSSIAGAATMGSSGISSSVFTLYLPGILFLGFIILSVVYLEKKR